MEHAIEDIYPWEQAFADAIVAMMCLASTARSNTKVEHDVSMLIIAECISAGVLRHNYSPDEMVEVQATIDAQARRLHAIMARDHLEGWDAEGHA